MAVTIGEREQDPSLLDVVERRVLSKQDESSILRRWARLFSFAVGDRLLTFGEETEGAGFSPGVKKPLAITKGERRGGVVSL